MILEVVIGANPSVALILHGATAAAPHPAALRGFGLSIGCGPGAGHRLHLDARSSPIATGVRLSPNGWRPIPWPFCLVVPGPRTASCIGSILPSSRPGCCCRPSRPCRGRSSRWNPPMPWRCCQPWRYTRVGSSAKPRMWHPCVVVVLPPPAAAGPCTPSPRPCPAAGPGARPAAAAGCCAGRPATGPATSGSPPLGGACPAPGCRRSDARPAGCHRRLKGRTALAACPRQWPVAPHAGPAGRGSAPAAAG